MSTKNAETAVAVIEPRRMAANIVPMNFSEMMNAGKVFATCGMFGCTTEGQGFVIAMTCQMQGITPLEFIELYHIINGRPSMRADAMLARFLEMGGSYEIITRTADCASLKASFRTASGTFTLTWEDAQKEPFSKGRDGKVSLKYSTPRSRMQMLWARVTSDAVRAVCPLANRGSYTPEEVESFDERDDAPQSGKVIAPPLSIAPAPAVAQPQSVPAPEPQREVVTPLEVIPPAQVDPSVMPAGRLAGKKWAELSDGQLQKVVDLPVPNQLSVTDAHKDAVRAELKTRGAA